MLVQTLYPDKRVYQLGGGIQTYLEQSNEESSLFRGKNFVFDPRRTDPIHQAEIVGECLVCSAAHDDYDNGHAPSEEKEARCNTCRMLILVCNACRPRYVCFGEGHGSVGGAEGAGKQLLYCGLDRCIHEGAAPIPVLLPPS